MLVSVLPVFCTEGIPDWKDQEDDDKRETEKEDSGNLIGKYRFNDVKTSDWFYDSVKYAVEKNLMVGVSDTSFKPNGTMTRAMLVTVLYRLAGEPYVVLSSPFKDLSQDWYRKAVVWGYQKSIIKGVKSNVFAPDESVTREQTAAILFRFASFRKYDVKVSGKSLSSFADSEKVSSYAYEALLFASDRGIIKGMRIDGMLCIAPKNNSTRAEIATMLQRFCTKYS